MITLEELRDKIVKKHNLYYSNGYYYDDARNLRLYFFGCSLNYWTDFYEGFSIFIQFIFDGSTTIVYNPPDLHIGSSQKQKFIEKVVIPTQIKKMIEGYINED